MNLLYSKTGIAILLILAGSAAVANDADGRSSNPNGWSAGRASNEIAGRVGATRPAAKPPARRSKPIRPAVRAKPAARRTAPVAPSGAEAADAFRLPSPTIVVNPSSLGLVGVESRFWGVTPGLIARDIEAGGVSAHVEARPIALVWDSGDGRQVETRPGDTPMEAATSPFGGVGFTYGTAAFFVVRCTVRWDVKWTASDGGSGTIPDRTSDAALNYQVLGLRSVLTQEEP